MKKLFFTISFGLIMIMCACSSNKKHENPQEKLIITSLVDKNNNLNRAKENEDNTQEVFKIDVHEDRIMSTLKTLCQTPRRWGSPEEEKAYLFLQTQLKKYGYTTQIQKFPVFETDNRYKTRYEDFFVLNPDNQEPLGYAHNLIGIKKAMKNNDKTFIISAHYDTNKGSIGAVDNASGTSVLLEIANQLKNFPSQFNIKFIFFSAEENHYAGSKYFVSQLSDKEKSHLIGCINVDMVGEAGAGELVMCTPQGIPTVFNFVIENTLGVYFKSKLQGGSDHVPFTVANIPGITFDQLNRDIGIMFQDNQMDYIDGRELKQTAEIITDILLKYDLALHEKLIDDDKEIPISPETIDINVNDIDLKKTVSGFSVKDVTCNLYNKGVSSTITHIYENSQGSKYYISQTPIRFTPEVDLSQYKQIKFDKNKNYTFYESTSKDSTIKLLVEGGLYLTVFKGNITQKQAMNIYFSY